MKYAVLTAKHHEGFCLFDSQFTDYQSTNTPFGRDIVKEYVDAFRAESLNIGIYYSLIDWHHPDFPIDVSHPLCNRPDAEQLDKGRDMRKYAEYMRNQVRELLTNYGKIEYAQFLHDGSEVLYSEGKSGLWNINDSSINNDSVVFQLPTVKPNVTVPVMEVILK